MDVVQVLKELMENSLDSGASLVQVYLSDGAVASLEVVDDGRGIQVNADFLSSGGTSKIQEFSHLPGVQTYGFRGEALACIAWLSDLEVYTHRRDQVGVRVSLENGEVVVREMESLPYGTRVVVKNLFKHQPVRRQDLVSNNSTYLARLTRQVQEMGVISAGQRVVLYSRKSNKDYKSLLDSLAPSDFRSKVAALFNPRLYRQMDALHLSLGPAAAHVLLLNSLTSGSMQQSVLKKHTFMMFVNNRPVDMSKALSTWITEVYRRYNPSIKALFVLVLSLDAPVDFNVYDKRHFYVHGLDDMLTLLRQKVEQHVELN